MARYSNYRVVAGMATMPTRSAYAERAIRSALKNTDKLYLFLDRFPSIPDYARHEKIVILTSQEWGDHRANGKLLGLTMAEDADYYLCCDDDRVYPDGFSNRLIHECLRYNNKVSAGIYGSKFFRHIES